MKNAILYLILLLFCSFIQAQEIPETKPVAPYSAAVMTDGGLLLISGQIPIDPTSGQVLKGNIGNETAVVMERIGGILENHGMDYSDLVKCTVFLTDIRDYKEVNEIYGSYFRNGFPAREAIEVANLPLGASIEISGIAVKKDDKNHPHGN